MRREIPTGLQSMSYKEEKALPLEPQDWERGWSMVQRALLAINQHPATDGFLLEFDKTKGVQPWKLSLSHGGQIVRFSNAHLGNLFDDAWVSVYWCPAPSAVDTAWKYLDSFWRQRGEVRRVCISAPRDPAEQFFSVQLIEGRVVREWLLPTLDQKLLEQVARDFDARRDRHRR